MSMMDNLSQSVTLKLFFAGLCIYYGWRIARFYLNRYKLYQTFKECGIPGPEPSLWDGSQSEFYSYVFWQDLIDKYRSRYGETFGYYAGNQPFLMITNLDLLQKIFIENPEVFNAKSSFFVKHSPLAVSVLFARGNVWKTTRRLLTPAFSRYRVKGEESTKFVDDSVAKMIQYIENKFDNQEKNSNSTEIDLNIMPLMKSTALHLISSMALHLEGVTISENDPTVAKLDAYFELLSTDGFFRPGKWVFRFPFLAKIFGFLSQFFSKMALGPIVSRLNEEIDKMKKYDPNVNSNDNNDVESRKHSSVLYSLVQLYKNKKMPRRQVLGNALALLVAGYDTTSNALTFVLYTLACHQNIQQRLRNQVSRDGIESKYLLQVINETLRLHTIVGTFTERIASTDIEINGLKIKRGVMVVHNAWLLHHDEKLWPEPFKFDPDRFEESKKYHPCAFAPFGLGSRLCLGYQLAMLEIKCVITELLTQYKWELISPKKMTYKTVAFIMNRSENPVHLKFTRL